MKISKNILTNINEDSFDLWKNQMDTKSDVELDLYLKKLYTRLYNTSDESGKDFYDVLKKVEYIENKIGQKPKLGRILH